MFSFKPLPMSKSEKMYPKPPPTNIDPKENDWANCPLFKFVSE